MMQGVYNVKTESKNCSSWDPPCSRKNDKDCTVHTSVKKSESENPRLECLTYGLLCTYTECNRRNGPDFGRVFLRSNYTDINQNTYIQS